MKKLTIGMVFCCVLAVAGAVCASTAARSMADADIQQSRATGSLMDIKTQQTIEQEVTTRFKQLVAALNAKDAAAWAGFYSKDGFVSAIAGSQQFNTRAGWVQTIADHFANRAQQHVEPLALQVTPLAANLALMTSAEKSQIRLKNGKEIKTGHAFTMLWKKEPDGWKIMHSHESWMDTP